MTNQDLAKAIAIGLIETGVEGEYDCITCSTAGDYPSIGCSQWEGSRADRLLSYLPEGGKFIGRTYSDLEDNDELEDLADILDSEYGRKVQLMVLADDTKIYVDTIHAIGVYNDQVVIYCGIWCPTSHYCVSSFLEKIAANGYDINNLEHAHNNFAEYYADFADCSEYQEGYYNRAVNTYNYIYNMFN